MYKIALLPGDGIGPEIVPQAVKVLQACAQKFDLAFEFSEAPVGGAAIDFAGHPLPRETLELCRSSDAVLLGAIGGPEWDLLPAELRPEAAALLTLRKELGLFANLRPVILYEALAGASPLKEEVIKDTDILVIRELTGGLYFGKRWREQVPGGEMAVDTLVYTTAEIERIGRLAFESARRRNRLLHSVDKANVLESSRLWREVMNRLQGEYPDVKLIHMYVDNAAMQLVNRPQQFDVIVTENMFGDILTDQASVLTGSIGMLASAAMGGRVALYEPAHGSAPDIAGRNRANPLATILSAALMLRYSFNCDDAAAAVEAAVAQVLAGGYRTADIMQQECRLAGTAEMGDAVAEAVRAAATGK